MSKIYVDEIRPKTSGNQVLFPTKPAFSAYLSSNLGTSDFTTEEILKFDTEDFDIGGVYNPSTGEFTAPVDGVYQLNVSATVDGFAGANWVHLLVRKNGSFIRGDDDSSYRLLYDPQGGEYGFLVLPFLVQLSAGDAITIGYKANGDTSTRVRLGASFSGYLVG